MQRIAMAAALSALVLAAAGCGASTGDRAISGGAIGAGAGALGGLVLGSPATGAVLGGAAGAATGALTDQNDIDLGRPIWR